MTKCEGCGYPIKKGDGFVAKHKGKRWHVGCLEHHVHSRRKTMELLNREGGTMRRRNNITAGYGGDYSMDYSGEWGSGGGSSFSGKPQGVTTKKQRKQKKFIARENAGPTLILAGLIVGVVFVLRRTAQDADVVAGFDPFSPRSTSLQNLV